MPRPGAEVNTVDWPEDIVHAPNIIELLLDIPTQATKFYIQSREKAEAEAAARSEGMEPYRSPCQGPATCAGPMTALPPYIHRGSHC